MAFDSTFDGAWAVVQQIYRDVTSSRGYNFSAGSDEQNDLRNRINGGQSMAEIAANTYDDANRRFPVNDKPNVQDTVTRDAQSNSGIQYQAPPQLIQAAVAAAGPAPSLVQAAAAGPGAIGSDLSSGPGGPMGPRAVAGSPGGSTFRSSTAGGTFNMGGGAGGGLFGFDMTTLLIVGAVGVGAWFLLKKK
jgi:hypothetical protein